MKQLWFLIFYSSLFCYKRRKKLEDPESSIMKKICIVNWLLHPYSPLIYCPPLILEQVSMVAGYVGYFGHSSPLQHVSTLPSPQFFLGSAVSPKHSPDWLPSIAAAKSSSSGLVTGIKRSHPGFPDIQAPHSQLSWLCNNGEVTVPEINFPWLCNIMQLSSFPRLETADLRICRECCCTSIYFIHSKATCTGTTWSSFALFE